MRLENVGESGNVQDRRGMKPAAVGGGIVGLLIILVGAYFGVDTRPLAQQVNQGGGMVRESGPPPDPKTKQFVAKVLKTTEEVWEDRFREMGKRYEAPHLDLFSVQTATGGCGTAPSAVGPFYCPADKKVYIDPSFFDELEQKLGGSKAEFSQAYVIAHEVGHHVQNLLGYNQRVRRHERSEGKNAGVRLELQADYLAGVWAHHGQKRFNFIERGDVEAALTTAKAIGDDRIQKKSQGWVSPESFTHGSADARLRWFRDGLESGDVGKLDVFFDASLGQLDPALR